MGWTETYPGIVAALVKKNGHYWQGEPKMMLADFVATLSAYSSALAPAITRVADRIVRTEFVSVDGLLITQIGVGDSIHAEVYLSQGVGVEKQAWKRRLSSSLFGGAVGQTFEPCRDQTIIHDTQLELIGFVRQAVADYQKALDQISKAAISYPISWASRDIVVSFLAALRALGSDLDVLGENPPRNWTEDVGGALRVTAAKTQDAVTDIAKGAGSVAAWTAETVGRAAGGAASGFFDTAGVTGILVAGLVAYVAFT